MAIYGSHNIVESLRAAKTPYWKLYRSSQDRAAGNYICAADFDNPDLGVEQSCEDLRSMLQKQTPGRYVLTAYKSAKDTKGGLGADIEVENNGHNTAAGSSAISGISSENKAAFVEGIGMVTLDNIGEVIEKKIKLEAERKAAEQRIKDIEAENARLKAEARDYDTGLNKGIMAIGAIVWGKIRNTPTGKEVIGMFSEVKKIANGQPSTATGQPSPDNGHPSSASDQRLSDTDAAISGEAPPEMINALEVLAENNDDLVNQLVMLARVKKENPEVFADAIENLKIIAG